MLPLLHLLLAVKKKKRLHLHLLLSWCLHLLLQPLLLLKPLLLQPLALLPLPPALLLLPPALLLLLWTPPKMQLPLPVLLALLPVPLLKPPRSNSSPFVKKPPLGRLFSCFAEIENSDAGAVRLALQRSSNV